MVFQFSIFKSAHVEQISKVMDFNTYYIFAKVIWYLKPTQKSVVCSLSHFLGLNLLSMMT